MTREEAIRHFEYGVSHDIFSEPVTSYAKMAIAALREQPRWISVEEALPPSEGVPVLAYNRDYPIMRTVNKVWWHKWLKQPYEGAAE